MFYLEANLYRMLVALALSLAAGLAPAADFPNKLVRLIVPFAPAGATDSLSRLFAQRLAARIGQSVIIENRAGAGGAVGTELVVKSPPDGHTLLFHSAGVVTDALLKKIPTYEVRRDLAPITMVVSLPLVLLVNNQLPVASVPELIAYAKQRPAKLNFGTPGIGSSIHLATELFVSMVGVNMVHVPYKGGGPSAAALMANEVEVAMLTITSAKPLATSGRVRAFAVTSKKRAGFWPELPTISEAAVPAYEMAVWYGLLAPQKTPTETLNLLNKESVAVLLGPEMRDWSKNNGMDVVGDSREEFAEKLVREIEQWTALLRKVEIRVE